ncbi:MAG TPA: carboxypeptidase-like regulatory domain-containing protein, partial [Terriglobia bacterium]|nr:carboxypeptidase-like regulatory domain-containing protein [Terriglobia bacterium]
MKSVLFSATSFLAVSMWLSFSASAQVLSTGSIVGSITDESDSGVPKAVVAAKSKETGATTTVQGADNGTYTVPALSAGFYMMTVTRDGFGSVEIAEVKVDAGKPSTVNVVMVKAGGVSQVVTVVGGGAELIQSTGVVGATVTGRQITDLPFTSRDALDWVLLAPGTSTPGRPRTSTINGSPKGADTIWVDGLNVQNNILRSSDGYFTFIRPRIDAIEEVILIIAASGADSNGDGAAQIKFVTRRGTNQYHGSIYEYHRNPSLNANYYFNNQSGLPRDRVLLNQFGGRLGGPLSLPNKFNGKDRAFFFVNYEEFRLPEQVSRDRIILNNGAGNGVFTTTGGSAIDLFSEAAATNCNPAGPAASPFMPCASTLDPTVQGVLTAIQSATSLGAVNNLDNNRQTFRFTNSGGQTRRFATVRLDFNLNARHTLENIWNYQSFRNKSDFVNFADPAFPGLEAGAKGQNSNRFSDSIALRSVLSDTLINEARFGVVGGTSTFYPRTGISSYDYMKGFSFGQILSNGTCSGGFNAAGISCPTASISSSKGNAPVFQFTDNLTWLKGEHTISFGASYSRYGLFADTTSNIV